VVQSGKAPGPIDILIAEDDAPTRTGLCALLELQGYRCAEAETGRQAVDVALTRLPRCVLLDLMMPELDGFAVARRLRADPRTRNIRIHCVTGRTDPAAKDQARQAGCELFLLKPVRAEDLLAVIRQQVPLQEPWEMSGLSKTEAEDLLDWLGANGFPPCAVRYEEGKGFAVREPG
jgi:CheY-like chemotaxis protein